MSETEKNAVKEDADELIAQCQLSSLYHEHRECFLNFWHRFALFIIISSSSILASDIVSGLFERLLILLPVILASLDLVFNLSTASQTHKFFRHRFSYIEAKLAGGTINQEKLNEVSKEITQLMAEEPPAYRVLLYHCTNLVDLEAGKTSELTKIPFYNMSLRNYCRFTGFTGSRSKQHKNDCNGVSDAN